MAVVLFQHPSELGCVSAAASAVVLVVLAARKASGKYVNVQIKVFTFNASHRWILSRLDAGVRDFSSLFPRSQHPSAVLVFRARRL
jgi:hypothetical protein